MIIIKCIKHNVKDLNEGTGKAPLRAGPGPPTPTTIPGSHLRSLAHSPTPHSIHQLPVKITRYPTSDHLSPPAPTTWSSPLSHLPLLPSPLQSALPATAKGVPIMLFYKDPRSHHALHTGPPLAALSQLPPPHSSTLNTQHAPPQGPESPIRLTGVLSFQGNSQIPHLLQGLPHLTFSGMFQTGAHIPTPNPHWLNTFFPYAFSYALGLSPMLE